MLIKEKDFEGFAAGCEKAFEVIFRQYYKTLVSFSMRYGLEQMEAEDVVIEVIHRIWEIRREIKSPAALNELFYTSVRNRTLNVVRNLKNRERIIGKQEKPEDPEFPDHLMEEEMNRVLNEAVEGLPPQCRQVILLILAGKTMTEIAGQLAISVSSVKTYKSRAIEILKVAFQNYPLLLVWLLFRLE